MINRFLIMPWIQINYVSKVLSHPKAVSLFSKRRLCNKDELGFIFYF